MAAIEDAKTDPTVGIHAAMKAILAAVEVRFDGAQALIHVIEDGVLQTVASESIPNSFTSRLGGAPAELLDQVAPSLARAAQARHTVFEHDVVASTEWEATIDVDELRWPSVATTAAIDDNDDIVGYVEIVRNTAEPATADELDLFRRVAACVAEVISNLDN